MCMRYYGLATATHTYTHTYIHTYTQWKIGLNKQWTGNLSEEKVRRHESNGGDAAGRSSLRQNTHTRTHSCKKITIARAHTHAHTYTNNIEHTYAPSVRARASRHTERGHDGERIVQPDTNDLISEKFCIPMRAVQWSPGYIPLNKLADAINEQTTICVYSHDSSVCRLDMGSACVCVCVYVFKL